MIVYKTTNTENGKVYIGQTITNNPYYYGSGLYIKRALKKYGLGSFVREIIDTANTQEELNTKEKYWASHFDSYYPNGYNIRECGGSKGKQAQQTKQKISKARKGIVFSEKHKNNLSVAHTGISLSSEAKRKLSNLYKGVSKSEETKQKISASSVGKTFSAESRLKMSLAKLGNKNCVGRVVSSESRLKMSLAKLGKTMASRNITEDLFGAKPKRKSINSKKKGDKNELACARVLLRWTGKHFSRIPRSGGLRWKHDNANICGDLVCQDMEYNFLFAVETKHLKEIFIPAILPKRSKVLTIWEQAKTDAIRARKHPIAFLRSNGMPEETYIVFVEKWLAKYFVRRGLSIVSESPTIYGFHSEDILSIPYEDVCTFVSIKVTLTKKE